MDTMTGGQALARQLVREGVTHIFGLPGDQIMHALDGLYDEPSIRFISTRHEQGTTFLADGYTRASGQPGVAFVVPGVGVYNAGAGLATAFAASSPVLLIAGQINRHGIGNSLGLLHEVHDQLDLVRPITAWQQRALYAGEIPGAVHEAIRVCAVAAANQSRSRCRPRRSPKKRPSSSSPPRPTSARAPTPSRSPRPRHCWRRRSAP